MTTLTTLNRFAESLYADLEIETGETPTLPILDWSVLPFAESHCLPVSQLKAGMKIHHQQTHATEGVYEVLSVEPLCCGWWGIQVLVTDRQGVKFSHSLIYRPNELVEVVKY